MEAYRQDAVEYITHTLYLAIYEARRLNIKLEPCLSEARRRYRNKRREAALKEQP